MAEDGYLIDEIMKDDMEVDFFLTGYHTPFAKVVCDKLEQYEEAVKIYRRDRLGNYEMVMIITEYAWYDIV